MLSSPRTRAASACLAALLPALFAACSYYDSSLLAPDGAVSPGAGGSGGDAGSGGQPGGGAGQSGSGGSAGAGAGGGSGAAGGGQSGGSGASGANNETQVVGCVVKPIGPPKESPAKKDGVEVLLAVQALDMGDSITNGEPSYKGYGFDLDGYCSCPADVTCKGADADKNRYCDGPDGRDNAGGSLISDFAKIVPDLSSATLNEGFSDGAFTLLFQIDKYNGEANDDQVTVAWLLGDNMAKGTKPAWDGNDTWPVQEGSYLEGGADPPVPTFLDKNAYVTNHVLVATLPGGHIQSQEFSLELVSPLLVATLAAPDDSNPLWHIDSGTIAARWKSKDILAQLSRIKDPLSKQPLCTDNTLYPGIKAQLCAYADISSTVQSQPNVPCDALSLGFRFKAVQAKLGAVVEVFPPENLCASDKDPANDSCD